MNNTPRPRKNRKSFAAPLVQHLWLLIPFSIIAFVVVLGVTKGRQQRPELVESFVVDSPGEALPPKSTPLPGEQVPSLGQKHIPEGQTAIYNSEPPTSGPHYTTPAVWGIHSEAPVDEKLVHNLEHGGIVISYNPEQIREEDLEQIKEQVRQLSKVNPRLVLTPRANLDRVIALTAWGYLQKLDSYDSNAIQTFYEAYVGRGPECQDGKCPG